MKGVAEYPASIEKGKDGRFTVTFPDFEYGATDGETLEEALIEARDCLSEIVSGIIAMAISFQSQAKASI